MFYEDGVIINDRYSVVIIYLISAIIYYVLVAC